MFSLDIVKTTKIYYNGGECMTRHAKWYQTVCRRENVRVMRE